MKADVLKATTVGAVMALVLFALWAPQDAAYEFHAVVRFLNHVI